LTVNLETGNWKTTQQIKVRESQASNSHFPVSIFDFLFSIFDFPPPAR